MGEKKHHQAWLWYDSVNTCEERVDAGWQRENKQSSEVQKRLIYEIWINSQLNTTIMSHSLTLIKGSDNMHTHTHTQCPSTLTNISRKDNALFSKESHNPPLSYCFFFLQISSPHCFQKSWCVVQPVHASLHSQYKFHLTATHSLYCVCDYGVIVQIVSVLHHWNNHHRTEEKCVGVGVCFWS